MALPPISGQIQSGAAPDAGALSAIFGSKMQEANTEDEQERVKQCQQMLQKAKQWKGIWGQNFKRWDNLWEGNHYKDRTSTTLTEAVVNQVMASIETFIGHVVDALPDPIARARRSNNKEKAGLITKWLKYEADTNDFEQEVQHPVRQSCKRGIGWFKINWNASKNGNRGDVDIVPVDDDFMFPSPYARNVKELLYLIEARNVPREFVVKNWEKGELVTPGPTDGSLSNINAPTQNTRNPAASSVALITTTTGSDSRWTSSTGVAGGRKSDLVTLIECWVREHDGKMRYTVIANNILLQDGPSPYEDEDFPYVPVNIIPTMDTICGRGLSQFIEGLQEILNEALSLLIDQQRFASDPMLIVHTGNLEEGNLVENSPGGVLPDVDPNMNGYKWLTAPGFNQAWIEIQKVISEYMDSVLGRVDVLKGERPVGVNTLGGLEVVRDEANVRLRNLIRWVRASMKRVYLLTLSRLRQYAKDERTIRIVGKLGKEDFATVNPTVGMDLQGGTVQDLTIPDDAEFDVEFAKESPGGRQAKMELALTLANTPAEDALPMVDRQYVLETCEIEEAPEIMERLNQQAQAQQEAAMAEQQAASGVPPQQEDPLDTLVKQLMMGGQPQGAGAPAQGGGGAEPPAEVPPSPVASGEPAAPPPPVQRQPSGEVVDVVRDAKGRARRFKKSYTYEGAA